uniref:(northern house mosquito) hypothetical protein n=1 Tax=Culex pipiens TaxID=7175 RepID=A0A8D8AAR1_CULPI
MGFYGRIRDEKCKFCFQTLHLKIVNNNTNCLFMILPKAFILATCPGVNFPNRKQDLFHSENASSSRGEPSFACGMSPPLQFNSTESSLTSRCYGQTPNVFTLPPTSARDSSI